MTTTPAAVTFSPVSAEALKTASGTLGVFVTPDGRYDPAGRRVNKMAKGAIDRLLASPDFAALAEGEGAVIAFPPGLEARSIVVVKLARRARAGMERKAGACVAAKARRGQVTLVADRKGTASELVQGFVLRAYGYDAMKSAAKDAEHPGGATWQVTCQVADPDAARAAFAPFQAVAEGVFMTRDLVSAPANVLTTSAFADQLETLGALGVRVEVLDEPALADLGMGALLGVGQGSSAPSKVVVMEWRGGPEGAAPLALIGKGVVFDTGGISLKPAGGMEDMTMDMGGAGVVAGTMKALAGRKAKANVVALVGLVENMPGPDAQRPGDIVTSMKGDTIEVINTDAEGRLVLADVMWYAQDRFAPAAMVDLATLTGAIIVALGNEMTGVFSNNDRFARDFLASAAAEGEGAWRLPLGPAYDRLLKSDKADMKNVGGRAAGSITAAQFLQRFVKDATPWIHLDIAGTTQTKSPTDLAPKGATGWGVRALDRLVRDRFETE